MQCPRCHTNNREGRRFCAECGASLALSCRACGFTNEPDEKYCGGCGDSLSAADPLAPAAAAPALKAERRQVTVMFCDLVGSTALSARLDPEDHRELIRAFHRCCGAVIDKAGGLVAQYMGDGVLAYFGYPPAHEDDAERAVRCGLALVDAVSKLPTGRDVVLQVRIGIATGIEVVGDLVRLYNADEPEVIGATPNLAARLQTLAEPNQVIIAASTRQLTAGHFAYRDLGRRSVKGLPEPIQAWQVVAESPVQSRFEARHEAGVTPLVGREEELDLLLRRWRQAARGDGCAVLLSGEPGIGKSRLITALQERLRSEARTELRYFYSPQHTDDPLFPMISQTRRAARLTPADSPEEQLAKLLSLLAAPVPVRDVEPAASLAARLSALEADLTSSTAHTEQSIALLADLLSVPTAGRYLAPELSPQSRKEKTLAAMVTHLGVLAAQKPVLLVFEDIHWIDPTSLELLTLTLERIVRWRVLALITSRPEFAAPWPAHPHLTTVTLRRLNQREAATLVEGVTGGTALPDEVLQQILDRTDGVPLFLEESTKSVLESGALREEGGHYRLTAPVLPQAVPWTLHSFLRARLDRIIQDSQIAQIGAAIGREFPYELLSAVAQPLPDDRLHTALERLVASGLVVCRGSAPPNTVYTFKHALVQDAAYDTLLRDQRRQLHARIATTLEERFPSIVEQQPALLAHHCTQAGWIDKAIRYWVRAGQYAFARSSTIEAITLLRKGFDLVDLLPDGPARWRQELVLQWSLCAALMVGKGQAALETGQAFVRSRELCEKLGDTTTLIQVLSGQCAYHIGRDELTAARQIADQLSALGHRHGDMTAVRIGSMHMGTCLYSLGDFASAREHLERVLALSVPDGRSLDTRGPIADRPSFGGAWDAQVASLSWLSLLLFAVGYPQQGLSRRDEALVRSQQLGHPHILAYGLLMAASFDWLRRAPNADSELDDLIGVCEEERFPHWLAVASILRAHALSTRGETADGLALARRAWVSYSEMGFAWGQTTLLAVLADCCEKANRSEEAFEALTTAITTAHATGERYFEAELYRRRGEWLAVHRQPRGDEAEADFHHALAVARHQQARMWELRAATSLGRFWRARARVAEARALVAPVYAWFTEGFEMPDLADARALLDSLR